MFQRSELFTRRFTQTISTRRFTQTISTKKITSKPNKFLMNKEGVAVIGSIFIGLGYSAYTNNLNPNNLLNPVLNYLSEMNELRLINNKLQDDLHNSHDLVLLENLNNKMYINDNVDELNIIEKEIIKLLKKNWKYIFKIKIRTEKMLMCVVNIEPNALKYISNQTYNIQWSAIKSEKNNDKFSKELFYNLINPSEHMLIHMVDMDQSIFKYINNPSDKICITAIKKDYSIIKLIKNPSDKVCLFTINNYPHTIKDFKKPTEKMIIAAIKQNGTTIQYIKNPTAFMRLCSIRQNGKNIQYIKNPTNKECILALRIDKHNFKYIENPSEYIVEEYVHRLNFPLVK